jgi:hypothetical protein
MLGRRRPLARAAVIGGGAYAIGKRRAQVEAEDAQADAPVEQPGAQEPAAPAGGLSEAAVQQLEQLGKLKEEGILTEEEFNQQKQKLLGAA